MKERVKLYLAERRDTQESLADHKRRSPIKLDEVTKESHHSWFRAKMRPFWLEVTLSRINCLFSLKNSLDLVSSIENIECPADWILDKVFGHS